MNLQLKIKKLDKEAKLPDYAYTEDVGLDLYSNLEVVMKKGERKEISTGIAMEIPSGFVGLIWDKSGLAIKQGIKILGGVIDSGYRGEIIIGLINLSNKEIKISKYQKIAQMIIQKKESVIIKEVNNLSNTERDKKGFGSSEKI
jgi:dUTP pyrophosphatase